MKGRVIQYSQAELTWIQAHSTLPRAQMHREFSERFARQDVSVANLHALCKRRGWRTGRDGKFAPGHASHNKGRKGYCAPGCEKGWFSPGERRGVAVKLYKPIGSERLSKDGYLERKIHDGLPRQSRWRAVHLIRWEALHGPVPAEHCLKCIGDDKTNTAPENWMLIPRALLPRLNGRFGRGYNDAPAEVKPTIMAITKLEHLVRETRKGGA